jgi:hypothetical protein
LGDVVAEELIALSYLVELGFKLYPRLGSAVFVLLTRRIFALGADRGFASVVLLPIVCVCGKSVDHS